MRVSRVVSRLRILTINRGKMDEWVKEWQESIVPLRRKSGFRVDAAWVVEGERRFVWILSYDGPPEDWAAREAAYYGSAERKGVDPDPARLIAHGEEWTIRPVPIPEG